MLKKVKHASGKREIFLFGKKIFEYVNHARFADFMATQATQTSADASLHRKLNALISTQIVLSQGNKDALFVLGQGTGISSYTPLVARNTQNIIRYLNLVRPFVSPNLKLVRVGGVGDGGYAMACLPEFNAVTPFNAVTSLNVTPPPIQRSLAA